MQFFCVTSRRTDHNLIIDLCVFKDKCINVVDFDTHVATPEL